MPNLAARSVIHCICLSLYLSVCLSVRPSVRLSVRPSVRLSVCLSLSQISKFSGHILILVDSLADPELQKRGGQIFDDIFERAFFLISTKMSSISQNF